MNDLEGALVGHSPELPWPREVFGGAFKDVDMSGIGRPGPPALRHILTFSHLDPDGPASSPALSASSLAPPLADKAHGSLAAQGLAG